MEEAQEGLRLHVECEEVESKGDLVEVVKRMEWTNNHKHIERLEALKKRTIKGKEWKEHWNL